MTSTTGTLSRRPGKRKEARQRCLEVLAAAAAAAVEGDRTGAVVEMDA
jgi:hypothetical protein